MNRRAVDLARVALRNCGQLCGGLWCGAVFSGSATDRKGRRRVRIERIKFTFPIT